MAQRYETDRKVLLNSFGILSVHELWHYLGERVPGWSGYSDIYISGRLDNNGNFLDENQIVQNDIIGYLEDHTELYNEYLDLEDKIKETKASQANLLKAPV